MNITFEALSKSLISAAKEIKAPISCSFELTPRCSLQCKMCYICRPSNDKFSITNERTTDEWINIARQVRDAGVLFLILTGGEVFIRKDFRVIYESIAQMGFSLQIYTNATLITPETAKWLGRIPPSRVSITLYGASRKTYERVCGFAEGFDRTIRGIDLLLAEGIPVEIKTTVVKGNSQEFEEIAKLIEARKVKFGLVNYISPRREGDGTDPVGERLSPQEQIEYDLRVEQYSLRKIKENNLISRNRDDFDISDTFLKDTTKKEIDPDDPFNCLAGKSGFWISWDGRMLPCGLMNEPVTYPFENGFTSAWEEMKGKCASIPFCNECIACSVKDYCEQCPGRLLTETGQYDKPAPYLCEVTRLRSGLLRQAR